MNVRKRKLNSASKIIALGFVVFLCVRNSSRSMAKNSQKGSCSLLRRRPSPDPIGPCPPGHSHCSTQALANPLEPLVFPGEIVGVDWTIWTAVKAFTARPVKAGGISWFLHKPIARHAQTRCTVLEDVLSMD